MKANLLCQSKICKLYRSIRMNQYIGTFDISGYEAIVSVDQNYQIEWKHQMDISKYGPTKVIKHQEI